MLLENKMLETKLTANQCHTSAPNRRLIERGLYWAGRGILEIGARRMFQLDILRHAPLPAGPKIIAPNHPTTTDPFLVLMLAPEQMSILIDDRLFKVPVFGRYLHRTGHIPVIPEHGRLAYNAGKQLLQAGRTLAVFPEGSVSPLEGGLYPPRTGVARLTLETGVPVIPVGIHLDRKRIRLIETEIEGRIVTGTWYLDGPYAMTVGEPMRFTGSVQNRTHVRAISEQIIQRIAHLAQESAARMVRTEHTRPVTGLPRLEPESTS